MQGRFKDLTSEKFGRLTVIERAGSTAAGYVSWRCKCSCGNTTVVSGRKLRQGVTKSCGCLRHELLVERNTSHGLSRTRLYRIWIGMRQRCYDPNAKNYSRYGGRGIQVCAEWRDDFTAFNEWAIAHGYERHLSIDRHDNDGDYDPTNCRWVGAVVQNNNRSNARLFTYRGRSMTLAQWSRATGISDVVLRQRINALGWPVERALMEPIHKEYSNSRD